MSHKTNMHPTMKTSFSCAMLIVALGAPTALAGCGSDEEPPSSGATASTTGSTTGSGGAGTGGGATSGTSGANGGSSASSGGGSGGADAWQGYCADIVEREEMCDPDNPPSPSLDECVAAQQCFDALFRDETREPLMECLRDRPCDKSDDACFGEVASAVQATPEQQAYQTGCADKLTACNGGFSDDWCSVGDVPWQLFPAALHTEMTACFSQPCEQVADCLEVPLDAALRPCAGELGF
jgi:hypothetical protein